MLDSIYHFISSPPTHLINSIKHEHSCKILYLFLQATKNDTGQQREKTEEERNKFEKGEHDLGLIQHVHLQGSHRLEKYLNIQECLEKSLELNLP